MSEFFVFNELRKFFVVVGMILLFLMLFGVLGGFGLFIFVLDSNVNYCVYDCFFLMMVFLIEGVCLVVSFFEFEMWKIVVMFCSMNFVYVLEDF